jgi:hypothetical protein
MPLASIRRADVQRYITERSAMVAAGSVIKELSTLKHLLGLAVDCRWRSYRPESSFTEFPNPQIL